MIQPRPPTDEDALRISQFIHDMAAALLDDPERSKAMAREWIYDQPEPIQTLHSWYLASTAPYMAATVARSHLKDVHTGDWGLIAEQQDPASIAVHQSFTCHVNGQHDTGRDIISAAVAAGGPDALAVICAESLILLADVIQLRRSGKLHELTRPEQA